MDGFDEGDFFMLGEVTPVATPASAKPADVKTASTPTEKPAGKDASAAPSAQKRAKVTVETVLAPKSGMKSSLSSSSLAEASISGFDNIEKSLDARMSGGPGGIPSSFGASVVPSSGAHSSSHAKKFDINAFDNSAEEVRIYRVKIPCFINVEYPVDDQRNAVPDLEDLLHFEQEDDDEEDMEEAEVDFDGSEVEDDEENESEEDAGNGKSRKTGGFDEFDEVDYLTQHGITEDNHGSTNSLDKGNKKARIRDRSTILREDYDDDDFFDLSDMQFADEVDDVDNEEEMNEAVDFFVWNGPLSTYFENDTDRESQTTNDEVSNVKEAEPVTPKPVNIVQPKKRTSSRRVTPALTKPKVSSQLSKAIPEKVDEADDEEIDGALEMENDDEVDSLINDDVEEEEPPKKRVSTKPESNLESNPLMFLDSEF